MESKYTNDWLRRKIASDPDDDPEAGPMVIPVTSGARHVSARPESFAVAGDRTGVPLRIALGVLVRQLRSSAGLSIADLAERADVSEEELRRVEHDPHYTARARLIHQLSSYFSVSLAMLSQMAGATHEVDRVLFNESVRFAARSDDVSRLTADESAALNAFVSLLNERAKA
ncbi:MAG: helix-turn-helix domain-containing protein [Pseudomonadota bacterium]|nr:helix-turn-helix domain-containing protein [Pseudomonadota bacterium]